MDKATNVVKELSLFHKNCDFEFLIGIRQFRCYKTSHGDYLAIIQLDDFYNVVLHKIQLIDRNNKKRMETLELVPLHMDKKYKLCELLV